MPENIKVMNVWCRWHFAFRYLPPELMIEHLESLAELKVDDRLVCEWHGVKGTDIKKLVKNANANYRKNLETQTIGKITFDLKQFTSSDRIKTANIWIYRSFHWEIDLDIPLGDGEIGQMIHFLRIIMDHLSSEDESSEMKTIGEITKRYVIGKLYPYLTTRVVLLNVYKNYSDSRIGSIDLNLPVEYTSLSRLDGGYIFFATAYKAPINYWFVFLHDSPAECVEENGRLDIIHDLTGLLLSNDILREEDEYLIKIEPRVIEGNRRVYQAIEEIIKKDGDLEGLRDEFMNCLELKDGLLKESEGVSLVVKHNEEILERLEHIGEERITGSGIISHIVRVTRRRNDDVNFKMHRLITGVDALEKTILNATTTETLSAIRKSISVEEKIEHVLESMHLMDFVLFMLNVVLFSEVFVIILEAYPDFHQFSENTQFALIISAILLSIIFSVIFIRTIIHKGVMNKILKID
ncbi:MAG: hypothetical protein MSIBF_00550 [Candidatus Altiarchaeales archaeon IMC4]|nr:MAG: hypothetical protein MSIBF_00550 [Candidatus Altiarchaeales archaeon IMC4]